MTVMRWLGWLVGALVLAGACAQSTRTRCNEATAADNCGPAETCVWTRSGGQAGYFCAIICGGGGDCPSGQSCKPEAAQSCAVCQDLLDICE